MINPTLIVIPLSAETAQVAWIASSADHVSWVFANGKRAAGPVAASTAARAATVPFPSGSTVHLEVHDEAPGALAAVATRARDGRRPTLKWAHAAGAQRYHVYHRPASEPEAVLISDESAAEGHVRVELVCPVALDGQGGRWHFFRVESVDAAGNESTRLAWPHRVMEPPAPVAITAANGSGPGLFNLTIGA